MVAALGLLNAFQLGIHTLHLLVRLMAHRAEASLLLSLVNLAYFDKLSQPTYRSNWIVLGVSGRVVLFGSQLRSVSADPVGILHRATFTLTWSVRWLLLLGVFGWGGRSRDSPA